MRVRAECNCDVIIDGVVTALFSGQEYDLPADTALPDGVIEVKSVKGPPEDKAVKVTRTKKVKDAGE